MRVQPLTFTVRHIRLPVGTNFDGMCLGSDEVSPAYQEVAIDVHLVPSLPVATTNTIVVGKSQTVCSRINALLHRLCLVRTDLPSAGQLCTSIACEGDGSLFPIFVNFELDLYVRTSP